MDEKIRAKFAHYFENFQAKIKAQNDELFALEWRNKNGSGQYMINYVLDKNTGTFYISGDLGQAVACWYNGLTPRGMVRLMNDPHYFIGKMNTSNRTYTYNGKDVEADLLELCGDYDTVLKILSAYEDCIIGTTFKPSYELKKAVRELSLDEAILDGIAGRRIDACVFLWQLGYALAMEQLEEEEAVA